MEGERSGRQAFVAVSPVTGYVEWFGSECGWDAYVEIAVQREVQLLLTATTAEEAKELLSGWRGGEVRESECGDVREWYSGVRCGCGRTERTAPRVQCGCVSSSAQEAFQMIAGPCGLTCSTHSATQWPD